MIGLLFRKQWKNALILVVFFCGILFVRNSIDSEFTERYYDFQKDYMSGSDLSQKDAFFEKIDIDTENAKIVVSAIENYESYDNKYLSETVDPLLITAGEANYADYNMVIWREEMLQMPGLYADTISDDYHMMVQLSQRLLNQRLFEQNLSNNIEIMKRGLRRNDGQTVKYKAVLSELEKIDNNFKVTDTIMTDKVLEYFETDYFILIITVLIAFGLFSNLHQNKISNQILISQMNTGRFCALQIITTALVCVVVSFIYYTGVILVLSGGDVAAIAWNLPIQAINGYEFVSFAVPVWQYVLAFLLFKIVFCFLLLSIVLMISALSKNTIISAFISFTCCGSLIITYHLYSSTLVIGSCKTLMEDLAFISVGEQVYSYLACAFCIAAIVSVVIMILVAKAYRFTAKKWVK